MVHAKLSPSAADRWMACPGSVGLCDGLPDEMSVYAVEGTQAHERAAERLEQATDTDDENLQVYLDAVRSIVGDTLIEQPVFIDMDCWGTADAIVWQADTRTLHVLDLKWGSGVPVFVDSTPQIRIYALGALGIYPDAEEVVMHIVQPRNSLVGHQHMVMSRDQIEQWGHQVLRPAMARAMHVAAPLAAGKHCRFCRARNTCPEKNR